MRIRYYIKGFFGAGGRKRLTRPVLLGQGAIFLVPSSQAGHPPYVVGVMENGEAVCPCLAYMHDKKEADICKHIKELTKYKKFPKTRGVLA